jgi:hypothetical protein
VKILRLLTTLIALLLVSGSCLAQSVLIPTAPGGYVYQDGVLQSIDKSPLMLKRKPWYFLAVHGMRPYFFVMNTSNFDDQLKEITVQPRISIPVGQVGAQPESNDLMFISFMPAKLREGMLKDKTASALEASLNMFRFSAPSKTQTLTTFFQPVKQIFYGQKLLAFNNANLNSLSILMFFPFDKLAEGADVSTAKFFKIEFTE